MFSVVFSYNRKGTRKRTNVQLYHFKPSSLSLVPCRSFQKTLTAYLLTPFDRGICQVDYGDAWRYIGFIVGKNMAHLVFSVFYCCVIPVRVDGHGTSARTCWRFGSGLWSLHKRVPLLCVTVDVATRLGFVLQDCEYVFFLHFTTHCRVEASTVWHLCGLNQKFKIHCQSPKAFSLPRT